MIRRPSISSWINPTEFRASCDLNPPRLDAAHLDRQENQMTSVLTVGPQGPRWRPGRSPPASWWAAPRSSLCWPGSEQSPTSSGRFSWHWSSRSACTRYVSGSNGIDFRSGQPQSCCCSPPTWCCVFLSPRPDRLRRATGRPAPPVHRPAQSGGGGRGEHAGEPRSLAGADHRRREGDRPRTTRRGRRLRCWPARLPFSAMSSS